MNSKYSLAIGWIFGISIAYVKSTKLLLITLPFVLFGVDFNRNTIKKLDFDNLF